MNALEILLTLGGYILLTIVVIALFVVLLAVAVGAAKGIRNLFKRPNSETYFREANRVAMEKYTTAVFRDELTEAFNSGALWGWQTKK